MISQDIIRINSGWLICHGNWSGNGRNTRFAGGEGDLVAGNNINLA